MDKIKKATNELNYDLSAPFFAQKNFESCAFFIAIFEIVFRAPILIEKERRVAVFN